MIDHSDDRSFGCFTGDGAGVQLGGIANIRFLALGDSRFPYGQISLSWAYRAWCGLSRVCNLSRSGGIDATDGKLPPTYPPPQASCPEPRPLAGAFLSG